MHESAENMRAVRCLSTSSEGCKCEKVIAETFQAVLFKDKVMFGFVNTLCFLLVFVPVPLFSVWFVSCFSLICALFLACVHSSVYVAPSCLFGREVWCMLLKSTRPKKCTQTEDELVSQGEDTKKLS